MDLRLFSKGLDIVSAEDAVCSPVLRNAMWTFGFKSKCIILADLIESSIEMELSLINIPG
jgi:hypothetical protein